MSVDSSVLRAAHLVFDVGVTVVRPTTIEDLVLLGKTAIRIFLMRVKSATQPPDSADWFQERTGVTPGQFLERLTELEKLAADGRPLLPHDRNLEDHFGNAYAGENPPLVAYADGIWQPAQFCSAYHGTIGGLTSWHVAVRFADGTESDKIYRTGTVATRDEFVQLLAAPTEFRVLWVAGSRDGHKEAGTIAAAMAACEL